MSSALVLSPQPHQAAGVPVFLWSMKASFQGQMCVLLCRKKIVYVYLGQRSKESANQKKERLQIRIGMFFNLLALGPHASVTLRATGPSGATWLLAERLRVALRYLDLKSPEPDGI